MFNQKLHNQKGMATIEFAALLSIALLMVFVIVDFGSLIQAQAVVTNVTREGGSLASRDLKNGPDLIALLEASSSPLNFDLNPERYKLYIAKIDAGVSTQTPDPTCTFQEGGTLVGVGIDDPTVSPTCDLTQSLYDLLKFDDTNQASPISQLTVVKVYYVHEPITPMEAFFKTGGNTVMNFDFYDARLDPKVIGKDFVNDSILIASKAVF